MQTQIDKNIEIIEIHNHSIIQKNRTGILICTGGKGTISYDGVECELTSRTLLVYAPYSEIRLLDTTDVKGFIIQADVNFTLMMLSDIPIHTRISNLENPFIQLIDTQELLLINMINLIKCKEKALIHESNDLSEKIIYFLIQSLYLQVIEIYQHRSLQNNTASKKEKLVYEKFINAVYTNCNKQRSVTAYANEQNISVGHFSSIIRKVSDRSPMYWIELFTMTRIKNLLIETSLSIKEITDEMSFVDQSTFGRYFKSHTKVSPSYFRDRFTKTVN